MTSSFTNKIQTCLKYFVRFEIVDFFSFYNKNLRPVLNLFSFVWVKYSTVEYAVVQDRTVCTVQYTWQCNTWRRRLLYVQTSKFLMKTLSSLYSCTHKTNNEMDQQCTLDFFHSWHCVDLFWLPALHTCAIAHIHWYKVV